MHQMTELSTDNSPDCCCHNQCATTPLSLSRIKLWAFSTFLRRTKHMQATKCKLWIVWGMIQYIPGHGVQHVLNSADHMDKGIVCITIKLLVSRLGQISCNSITHNVGQLHDSSMVLFGLIRHLQCQHLTVSHCLQLCQCICSFAQLVVHCDFVRTTV